MAKINAIHANMIVVDLRGNRIGTVDDIVEGGEIKLARTDSPDGVHHYIPLEWVGEVDNVVTLNRTCTDVIRDRD